MSAKYAIIIAIENYIDTSISKVLYAERDAVEFARSLEHHGFNRADITILLNARATKTIIESNLRSILASADSDDEIYVFYAGHGFAENDHNYLTCGDTLRSDLTRTSTSMRRIFKWIRESRCKKVILFLDSCHSGLDIDEAMRDIVTDMNDKEFKGFFKDSEYHFAFASCQIDEKSHSSKKLKHGIWSYHIIEALNGNVPQALERRRYLTADSLQTYLIKEVPRTIRQTFTARYIQTPCTFGNRTKGFIIADLQPIIEERRQKLEPKLAQLKKVFFSGSETGSIKSLSGFKKGHRVPDSINSATEGFVNKISGEKIKTYSSELFESLRQEFKYKRRDLNLGNELEGTSIITKDFTVNICIEINPDDFSEYILTTEVVEIQNPDCVNSEAFNNVFSDTFSSLTFQFNKRFNIVNIVDRIEEINEPDLISVDYPSDLSSCTISIEGFKKEVIVTPNNFIVRSMKNVEPKVLLKAFNDAQILLVNKHDMKMLPLQS